MTQGKIERYHRSLKNVVKLEHYYTPREVERAVGGFAEGFVNLPDAGRVAGQDPNLGGCSRSTRHHVPFGERSGAERAVLAPVAVDRSPSPPRSWAKTAGSPQVHLSDARDRRDGLRQARV